MRNSLFYLMALSAFVTACSKGSDNKAPPTDGFVQEYDTQKILSNPASSAYLTGLLEQLQKSDKILPEKHAIYTAVVSGMEAETVSTEDRQKAERKLSADGLGFLNQIKRNCVIENADVKRTGDQEYRTGAISTAVGTQKISGASCPILEKIENSMTMKITRLSTTDTSASVDGEVSSQYKSSRTITDPRLAAMSGMLKSEVTMTLSGHSASLHTKGGGSSGSSYYSGNGTFNIALTDKSSLYGTFRFETMGPVEKTLSKAVLEAQSGGGSIRVVLIQEKEGDPTVFVNGIKVEGELLKSLGFGSSIPR